MRWLKRMLATLAIVILALVVIAYFLPREVTVTRSITVAAAPEKIFPHLDSTQAMAAWSPWLERDPNVKQEFAGPERGVGNKLSWQSDEPDVGSGSQEITAITPNERVETRLDFGPRGTATAWLALKPAGEATEVTWGFHTDLGMNPIARYFGLMFPGMIGADYDAGLARLKALVEKAE